MSAFILAIDQGTTSSRALLFDAERRVAGLGQRELPQSYPRPGWVEHAPDDIWSTVITSCREAIEAARAAPEQIAAIGVTNQRETAIVWDRATGRPIHPAIVWQDRRTSEICATLRAEGLEPMIAERSGLLADPYFSSTKIAWLLDHVDGARARAERGELLFGTVDSYLIWRLTGGAVHATDATNAARTMLCDIRRVAWDEDLCGALRVPMAMLPEIRDTAGAFGETEPGLFGRPIPIRGVAGDQQAATIGQACFQPGMLKSTYGTGCFALLNTGETPVASSNRLLTTIAYRIGGRTTYALEGSIFVAGSVVQWLRDGLGFIGTAPEVQALAEQADPAQEVTLVPAFTGLGAPYWDAEARGAIFGLTRGSGRPEIAKAALESVGFQTRDLLEAMRKDWAGAPADETVLRVDGGMSASDWTMQFVADALQAPTDRPTVLETTALGAAWLAGMASGLYPDADGFAASWARERRFAPAMSAEDADRAYARWRDAVRRTRSDARSRSDARPGSEVGA